MPGRLGIDKAGDSAPNVYEYYKALLQVKNERILILNQTIEAQGATILNLLQTLEIANSTIALLKNHISTIEK